MIKKMEAEQSDRISIAWKRRNEKVKFKDPRRVEIYKKVQLTDEQKNQIDEVYINNYGSKIPYTWHRHYTAFTGKFDPYYFPELLYIPEFEHFMNIDRSYTRVFAEKNVMPILADEAGVRMPHTYVSGTAGIYRNEKYEEISVTKCLDILKDLGRVFIKPSVNSNSGQGCFVADFRNGIDLESGKCANQILSELGPDFIVQERIRCHKSISTLYPDSVNTFRIITYRWKGKYCHMPVILRIGQGGGYVDNAHAGGMFVGVSEDGILCSTAFTEFQMAYTTHPNTGVKFEQHQINHFSQVLKAARRMSEMIPQVGCVNWDFTIDEDGAPVLIEGNMKAGSVWLPQMAHGCGSFGEKTPEVLQWLALMKKTPVQQRNRYRHGNTEV